MPHENPEILREDSAGPSLTKRPSKVVSAGVLALLWIYNDIGRFSYPANHLADMFRAKSGLAALQPGLLLGHHAEAAEPSARLYVIKSSPIDLAPTIDRRPEPAVKGPDYLSDPSAGDVAVADSIAASSSRG